MKFIDLHTDLVNYFLPDERQLLGMKLFDFDKSDTARHADIPGYLSVGTKVVVASLFPLSVTQSGVEVVDPKLEIARQLQGYQKVFGEYPTFVPIRNQRDFARVIESKDRIGVIINMEGGEAILSSSDLTNYWTQGVRSLGLTWNYDNSLAGGANGKSGLKKLGREVLQEAGKLGLILDLVHSSRETFDEAIEDYSGPVMVSHCAMNSIYPHKQNLSNEQIKKIVERNGLVGISLLSSFYSKSDAEASDVVRHCNAFRAEFGTQNIAIGTDYFGFGLEDGVNGLERVSELTRLDALLSESGWSKAEREAIFYSNALRFLKDSLPQ